MSDEILDEQIIEEWAPVTPDELVAHLIQDIIGGSPSGGLADEFVDEFVLQPRPETGQILALLETPSQSLVEMLKQVAGQGYQATLTALDLRGAAFLDNLKSDVKERMTQLAGDAI